MNGSFGQPAVVGPMNRVNTIIRRRPGTVFTVADMLSTNNRFWNIFNLSANLGFLFVGHGQSKIGGMDLEFHLEWIGGLFVSRFRPSRRRNQRCVLII